MALMLLSILGLINPHAGLVPAFFIGEIMKITIEIKGVYGLETIYPACDIARLFARLAGTKTITRHALETIKLLGYEIEVKQKTI